MGIKEKNMKKQKDFFNKELAKIIKILVTSYKPERVVLFGSAGRGDYSEDSDLDLLVIKEGLDKITRQERSIKVNTLLPHNLPMDILVYTPYEIKKRLYLGDPFIKNILSEGRVLYGS